MFLVLNVIMLFTFVQTVKSDPGYLPCNSDEYELSLKKVFYLIQFNIYHLYLIFHPSLDTKEIDTSLVNAKEI